MGRPRPAAQTMQKILIIDDDERLAEPLRQYFARFELVLESATRPLDGIERLRREHFDLVILDVMLPEIDGLETCRRIRQFSDIPVVMLTARGLRAAGAGGAHPEYFSPGSYRP